MVTLLLKKKLTRKPDCPKADNTLIRPTYPLILTESLRKVDAVWLRQELTFPVIGLAEKEMSNLQDTNYTYSTENHFRGFRITASPRSYMLLERLLVLHPYELLNPEIHSLFHWSPPLFPVVRTESHLSNIQLSTTNSIIMNSTCSASNLILIQLITVMSFL